MAKKEINKWVGAGKVVNKGFIDSIPEKAGIYVLFSFNQNGTSKTIGRAVKDDKNGTLYIGEAANLKVRLGKLKQSLSEINNNEPHSAGERYNQIKSLKRKFPLSSLRMSYLIVKTHRPSEKKLLNEYEQAFGELPPLNRSK